MKDQKRWIVKEVPENEENIPEGYIAYLKQYLLDRNIQDERAVEIFWQMLYKRGIRDEEAAKKYLSSTGSLYDPFDLPDMDKAVNRILSAIEQEEKIIVYGDFDADGVTASALLVQVLKTLGGFVEEHIPHRVNEGYGLNIESIKELANEGCKLIITVDCGIRSPQETEFARSLGIDMIISDHHNPQEIIPPALAVIDPKRADSHYPNRNLAGVGVAYKIAQALFKQKYGSEAPADEWLDLVAIGTVADIVPLVDENRTLVKAGLKRLRASSRKGVISLMNVARVNAEKLSARDIGFMIGPRINAAGRLQSAKIAFDLLVTADQGRAGMLAQELDDINGDRKRITQSIQKDILGRNDFQNSYLLFDVDPAYKLGVVGLAASRLTEESYRPAVVGAVEEKKGTIRASCRSIPEFHITNALDECADLLVRYGGHAMAAGFTVKAENRTELENRLSLIAKRELQGKDLQPTLVADISLSLEDLKPYLLRLMQLLEPTGSENPPVLFISEGVTIKWPKLVGHDQQHLRMSVNDSRVTYNAIAFRQGKWKKVLDSYPKTKFDLLYSYELNEYRDSMNRLKQSLQLRIVDMKPTRQ